MIAPANSLSKTPPCSSPIESRSQKDHEILDAPDSLTKLQRAAKTIVVGQPVASLVVAVTAGLVLGWLVKRKWNV